jgi:nicotinamidase-related amidase
MDMTNDFVFEKYEHEGEEYEGRLVAPLAKSILEPIAALVRRIINNGTVSLFRLSKDNYDVFTNPELELKIAELGIDEVFMTGLVDEMCIYQNALGFLERSFRTNIVKGFTAPFGPKKEKKL